MAKASLNMFAIATELAQHDPIYEPMAVKYFEHFLNMAHAMSNMSGEGINLWDEEDQFFYDVIHLVHALREFHAYYGDSFTVECPTGSGRMLTPDAAARELAGRLINISSVHEDWPMPGNTAYCLSKGGMRMLTRTAGVELAPYNILVVGVGPGAIATPINTATLHDPIALKKLDAAIPLGRVAQPEEIASIVAFLTGDGARYMTATTVFADGGIMQSSPGL
jgi:NAD(P)-dependent dehydrogenase (short-subunit alcohol dehydrogenase family)